MLQGLFCGIGGGLVGACVWATIAHFMGQSADFAAWIVGVCVGVGVAFGAQPKLNVLTGLLAMALAAASVIVGSFAAAEFATGQRVELARTSVALVGAPLAIAALQDEIAAEWQARDAKAAPAAESGGSALPKDYTGSSEVIAEARVRWARMGLTQRQLYKGRLADARSEAAGVVDMPIEFRGYFARLSPMQIVWGSLALLTAFKVGATPGRRLDELEMTVAESAKRNNPVLRGAPTLGAAPGSASFPPIPAGPSAARSPHVAPAARQKAA